jgi:hypothetical protein
MICRRQVGSLTARIRQSAQSACGRASSGEMAAFGPARYEPRGAAWLSPEVCHRPPRARFVRSFQGPTHGHGLHDASPNANPAASPRVISSAVQILLPPHPIMMTPHTAQCSDGAWPAALTLVKV